MKTRLAAGLVALAFTGAAMAQEAVPPAAPVPVAPEPLPLPPPPPSPAIAASQATSACVPALVPEGGRCTVAGSAMLGGSLTWAFYDVRGPGGRHGVSVLLAPDGQPSRLKAAATLTTSGAAIDRWKRGAYSVAGLVEQGEDEFAGMAVRGAEGIEAFSLHRVEDGVLTPVPSAGLPAALAASIASLVRPGCRVVSGGMDWRFLRVRHGLMGDDGACGTVMLDLGVEDGAVKITDTMAIR